MRTILTRYRPNLDYIPYLVCDSAHRSAYVAATHEVHWLDFRGRLYIMYLCLTCARQTKRDGPGQVVRLAVLGMEQPDEPDPQLTIDVVS